MTENGFKNWETENFVNWYADHIEASVKEETECPCLEDVIDEVSYILEELSNNFSKGSGFMQDCIDASLELVDIGQVAQLIYGRMY